MDRTILLALGGAAVVLVVASLVGFALARRTTSEAGRASVQNLNDRTRAWWVMVAVFGGALLLGAPAVILLFALLSFMALREFWTLAPSRPGDQRALFLSFFVVLPVQYLLLADGWYGLFSIFIPVYAFLALPAISTLAGDTENFLARSARVQWGLMLGVYALSHAPGLTLLDTAVPASHLLVFLVVVVQSSDVLQYVFGKLMGRHRFSPRISPSKTVEGLAGGGLSAILVGVALSGLTPFSLAAAAGISAAIVVAGFFGGFVLSAVKRDLGAKDWGTMIEGHGGVLDRLDSIIFAAPIFFHLVRYWYTA
jgi:phosphatidate cytidylyltransferase